MDEEREGEKCKSLYFYILRMERSIFNHKIVINFYLNDMVWLVWQSFY